MFQRWKFAGSCQSTLPELLAGLRPSVIVGVADFFEVDPSVLQK